MRCAWQYRAAKAWTYLSHAPGKCCSGRPCGGCELCASSLPHGGGKHGRDTAQAHECGGNAMAAGVQRTQHAGTRGQLCSKGRAAQAGSGGQVQAGHGVGHEGSGNYAARPGRVLMTPCLSVISWHCAWPGTAQGPPRSVGAVPLRRSRRGGRREAAQGALSQRLCAAAWHRRSTACAICGTSGAANDMRSVCRSGASG